MFSHMISDAIDNPHSRAGFAVFPFLPLSPLRIDCGPQKALRRYARAGAEIFNFADELFHASQYGVILPYIARVFLPHAANEY